MSDLTSPDYRSLLSNPDPVVAVVEFMSARFGLQVEPCDSGDGSWALLCNLWDAGAERVFGKQNHLLRGERRYWQDDLFVFYAENQGVWAIGVTPTEDGDPQVFSVVTGDPPMPLGMGLAEFLIRAAVEEAIFSSPWTTTDPDDLEATLAAVGCDVRLLPAVPVDRIGNRLPSIWADGEALAMGFESEGTVELWAGAATVEAFELSRIGRVRTWSEWTYPTA